MPVQFVHYINQYGYIAIFVLILIQEIGIPTPVPNELLMLFSGYLAFTGALKLYLVLLVIITADVLGANILYTVFYYFGPVIIRNKPKWFPLSTERIDKISARVSKNGLWTVFFGRITPLIRGYISVIVGLLHISPQKYVPITLITAIIVTCTYVNLGFVFGPYWTLVAAKLATVKYIVLVLILIIAVFMLIKYFRRKKAKRLTATSSKIQPLDS